jgi:hypothetical protein
VTEASSTGNDATPILARQARYLAGVARRAPSLHNTQHHAAPRGRPDRALMSASGRGPIR